MRAVGVTEFGPPEALRVVELPDPQAGPGEVRIRVHAAAVNPTDTFIRAGTRQGLTDVPGPYVPGMDLAGVIDQVGPGVRDGLAVGQAVTAIVRPGGTFGAYSEFLAVSADSVAPIPAGASFAESATLPMNGLTAVRALDLLALQPGQWLAVTGAAGAFGGYMVKLGKVAGLRVVADASATDRELVRSLGADVVVERGAGFAAAVRQVVSNGVDGLADGALLHTAALPAIRDGGKLAAVRPFQGETERGIETVSVLVVKYLHAHDKLDALRSLAEQGKVTLRVARAFPAEQAAETHRLLEAGGTRGRFIIEL